MRILSREAIRKLTAEEPGKHTAVVISEPQAWVSVKDIVDNCKDAINPVFFDTEGDRVPGFPTMKDIKEILEWALDRDTENLLVACRAGISRSSATAFLIERMKKGPEEAIKVLDINKHTPNRLIIKHGAALLSEPKIRDEIEQYYNSI